jgi:hypothetical protein
LDQQSHQVFTSAMEATWWLNEHMEARLGEKNAADTLTQSVPHNVTSEMGAGAPGHRGRDSSVSGGGGSPGARRDEDFLDELANLTGGLGARDAIRVYLDKYGCAASVRSTSRGHVGANAPTALAPLILGNIKNFEPGASERRFEQGRQEA